VESSSFAICQGHTPFSIGCYDARIASEYSGKALEKGVNENWLLLPVPKGKARIRTSLGQAHKEDPKQR
jgi:7-keto-8-aminopelargonate synthetase-like enzyme